jgi:hypothetical protein
MMAHVLEILESNNVLLIEILLAGLGIGVTAYFSIKTNKNLWSMQQLEDLLSTRVKKIEEFTQKTAASIERMQELERSIDERVLSVEDATRRLRSGLPEMFESMIAFLTDFKEGDDLFIMTDTAAVGRLHERNQELLTYYKNQGWNFLDDVNTIHKLIFSRSLEVGRFFFTTLRHVPESTNTPLVRKFIAPVLKAIGLDPSKERDFIDQHIERHLDIVEEFKRNRKDRNSDIFDNPHREVDDLPLQMFIRNNTDRHRLKALVIFAGTYNMEKIQEVNGMLTRDPKLVDTFISMYSTISGLDHVLGQKEEIILALDEQT